METKTTSLKEPEVQPDGALQVLRGTHSGRIWIIGNGPSLRGQWETLGRMNDEPTFVVNSFFREPPPGLRPTFYAANYVVWKEGRVKPTPETNQVSSGLRFFLNSGPYLAVPGWVMVLKKNAAPGEGVLGLGEEVLHRIPSSATSPYVMAQLAGWMGFNEIYFLGCEQTDGYFYDREEHRDTPYFLDRFKGERWRILKRKYEAAHIKVRDCTPGGLLNNILGYEVLEEVLDG